MCSARASAARAGVARWYHLASPSLAATARKAEIYKDVKFSDHAPLTIDYDFAP